MLGFNFILGLNFIFLCFKLIIIHYHTQKQRQIKFKPRIKLNHTRNNMRLRLSLLELVHLGISQGVHFRKVAVEIELAENLMIPNLLLVFDEIT